MELKAITGFLNLDQGVSKPVDQMAGILAQRAPRKADKNRRNDFLFAHLTLSQPTNRGEENYDALPQDLVEAFANTYFKTNGTINTALRQAVRHINGLLLNWNIENGGFRREGALTAVVMVRNELLILQAGPAIAMIGHNFGIERFPSDEIENIERSTPLGQSVNLDLRFHNIRLKSGDMLLMTDPLAAAIPTQAMHVALVDTEVEIGLEELKEIFAGQTVRLMLIEFSEEAPLEYPDSDLTIETFSNASGQSIRTRPIKPLRAPQTPSISQITQKVETATRRSAAAAAQGASQMVDGAADLLDRFDLEDDPDGTGTAPQPVYDDEEESNTIPLLVALIIPILIAIVFTNAYFQRVTNLEINEIVSAMQSNLELAAGDGDTNNQRTYFLNVLALGERAELIRPQDSEVIQLRNIAREQLDRLDSVFRLNAQLIYTYDGEEANLTAVEIDDQALTDIYVLDIGEKKVYRHPTNSGLGLIESTTNPEEIMFTGQPVGSHVIGDMADIMWRPKGAQVTRDGLSVLDSRGALINYFPAFGDLQAIKLGMSSAWRGPEQIKPFAGRLYVLDGQAGYVWKYFPADDTLTFQESNQAITFFDNADLGNAVDFDIFDTDGSVLVLYSNGQLKRFFDGRVTWDQQKLIDGDLKTPLLGPTSIKIVGQSTTSSFFVLDPASNRLLQFARNGDLVNQFRATDENGLELFSQAVDFVATPSPLKIVVITENKVYLVE